MLLEKVDIHITDHCNLNCKSCTHFSPLAEEFYLDSDDFERDINRLSELTKGDIGTIFLLGGEPLLHPELIDFLPITRKAFPNSNIVIITNGILLPSQPDRFWKACRRSNVHIWVSKYTSLNIDYAKAESMAKKHSVSLFYTSTSENEQKEKVWLKYKIDPEGKQDWLDSFQHCAIKNCVTLKKGKLYTCCTLAHIEHFNKYFNKNMEVSQYDYIDIYKINTPEMIAKTMVRPVPFCRYCKPNDIESGIWAQSKKEISEWI